MRYRTGIQYKILTTLLLCLLVAGVLLVPAARPALAQDGAPGIEDDNAGQPADPEDDDVPTAVGLQSMAVESGGALLGWAATAFAALALLTGLVLVRRRPRAERADI